MTNVSGTSILFTEIWQIQVLIFLPSHSLSSYKPEYPQELKAPVNVHELQPLNDGGNPLIRAAAARSMSFPLLI